MSRKKKSDKPATPDQDVEITSEEPAAPEEATATEEAVAVEEAAATEELVAAPEAEPEEPAAEESVVDPDCFAAQTDKTKKALITERLKVFAARSGLEPSASELEEAVDAYFKGQIVGVSTKERIGNRLVPKPPTLVTVPGSVCYDPASVTEFHKEFPGAKIFNVEADTFCQNYHRA